MHVAIIGRANGKGLERDNDILISVLNDIEIPTTFKSIDNVLCLEQDPDLCIFTEVVDPRFYGKKNVLIPNQEWFHEKWLSELPNFDAIFCKSRFATEIFRRYHRNVIYTGFTSRDLYIDKPKLPICLHSKGSSGAKGTSFVIDAWQDESLPLLHLITNDHVNEKHNITMHNNRMPELEYVELMNECLIHVYPSQTEGFGHCINEARGCGAIVITTNFPPMNELVSGTLAPTDKIFSIPGRLGYCATVDVPGLTHVVKKVMKRANLQQIGQKNRERFLVNDERFRRKFIQEISRL